jgi:hypothetical protein
MLSIGPMECLFSSGCWANLDFPLPYLKSWKCSWKTDFERSSSLSNILHVACGACYLINPTVFVFTFGTMVSCRQKVSYSTASRKCDFHISILEYLCDSSCLSTDICKLSPMYFSYVLLLFLLETQVSCN